MKSVITFIRKLRRFLYSIIITGFESHLSSQRLSQCIAPSNLSIGSFQYVCGDFFLGLGHILFKDTGETLRDLPFSRSHNQRPVLATEYERLFEATHLALELNASHLILHNTDAIPPLDVRSRLSQAGIQLWSPNISPLYPSETCLPLGIPNPSRNLSTFTHFCEQANQATISTPPGTRIFASFSVSTHPETREECLSVAHSINAHTTYVVPSSYYQNLRLSGFSLCPRGNGIDTYRTWESLYLGTIPILLETDWLHRDLPLPVMTITRWADLLHISPDSLRLLKTRFLTSHFDLSSLRPGFWFHKLYNSTSSVEPF